MRGPDAFDAVATAPINKLAFAKAGLPWKGHTDLLAHLCGWTRWR
jgi:4-hydroxy-L-threonine phosphate dehydrogenase PdxA